jgi:uncharacterized protein (DUF58 family)
MAFGASAKAKGFSLLATAERQASAFPPLLVAAERVAATVQQGVHGRRRSGQGEAFWQHRRFQIGDAPRLIDWRQSGKSDRLYIREMEWEASQSVWLWMNAAPSMQWRSSPLLPTKAQAGALCLMALASLLGQAGELIGLLGEDHRPSRGQAKLHNLALVLDKKILQSDSSGKIQPSQFSLPPQVNVARHSVMILFSDFFAPFEEIQKNLMYFAERGVKAHVIQILDPAEVELPYSGRVRFEDVNRQQNNESQLFSRVESIREKYQARLYSLQGALQDFCRHTGWHFYIHRTDAPLTPLLMSLHQALSPPRGVR